MILGFGASSLALVRRLIDNPTDWNEDSHPGLKTVLVVLDDAPGQDVKFPMNAAIAPLAIAT